MKDSKNEGGKPQPGKKVTNEALEDAIASIQKNYGDGSIMRMGDDVAAPIDGISTGSLDRKSTRLNSSHSSVSRMPSSA